MVFKGSMKRFSVSVSQDPVGIGNTSSNGGDPIVIFIFCGAVYPITPHTCHVGSLDQWLVNGSYICYLKMIIFGL